LITHEGDLEGNSGPGAECGVEHDEHPARDQAEPPRPGDVRLRVGGDDQGSAEPAEREVLAAVALGADLAECTYPRVFALDDRARQSLVQLG
jgi:hypothetical protein